MNATTRQMITLALTNDNSVTPEHKEHILRACSHKHTSTRRRLGTVKQAAAILSCHPKTVYRYARRGSLTPIHYSTRKVRFDLNEVERFAANGLPT